MEAAKMPTGSKYECLLFDLDDTLYPMSSGLNFACRKNIEEYMLSFLNMEESEVPKMCFELYREHGTTMAGLKAIGYEFDNDEYHAVAHGRLPYEKLKPDPILRNLLLSMPQRKIIFTNADKPHVDQVLRKLGLEDCFEGIICFETLNPSLEPSDYMDALDVDNDVFAGSEPANQVNFSDDSNSSYTLGGPKSRILCKPALEAFEAAIQIANLDPKKTIFFDDSVRNIATGKEAGLHTVVVGRSELVSGADHALNSIHNIKEAIPEIWEGEGEQPEQVNIQSTTVETVVLA
ncbi:hypothetical protein ACFE04_018453 [Oxalis oulophora]